MAAVYPEAAEIINRRLLATAALIIIMVAAVAVLGNKMAALVAIWRLNSSEAETTMGADAQPIRVKLTAAPQ